MDEITIPRDENSIKDIQQKIRDADKDSKIKVTGVDFLVGLISDVIIPHAKLLITGRNLSIDDLQRNRHFFKTSTFNETSIQLEENQYWKIPKEQKSDTIKI